MDVTLYVMTTRSGHRYLIQRAKGTWSFVTPQGSIEIYGVRNNDSDLIHPEQLIAENGTKRPDADHPPSDAHALIGYRLFFSYVDRGFIRFKPHYWFGKTTEVTAIDKIDNFFDVVKKRA
jgi:hypothetical protein